ncbi:MAG: hypothetical protein ABUS56_14235 [Acidobacteriota bacterium]
MTPQVLSPGEDAVHRDHIGPLLSRARSEFLEMPGLRLTPVEAARLWAVDRVTSEQLLTGLAAVGFLCKNGKGAYLRASVA